MRRLRLAAVLALVALAALAGVFGARAATRAEGTAQVLDESFASRALDSPLHYLVMLPPDYDTSGLRYPVLYFLHGLPAGPDAYRSVAWVANAH